MPRRIRVERKRFQFFLIGNLGDHLLDQGFTDLRILGRVLCRVLLRRCVVTRGGVLPLRLEHLLAFLHLLLEIFFFLLLPLLQIHPHFSYFSFQETELVMQSLVLIGLWSNILAGLLAGKFSVVGWRVLSPRIRTLLRRFVRSNCQASFVFGILIRLEEIVDLPLLIFGCLRGVLQVFRPRQGFPCLELIVEAGRL